MAWAIPRTPFSGVRISWLIVARKILLASLAASAADVPEALAAAGGRSDKVSIAVLPFVNMSSDPEQEYFSDGLSEELLNQLAHLPQLRVIARTSSFSFKGKDVDVATIAEALDVGHVLEGSVRRAGDRLRITAQLIRTADSSHLWSQTYDRTVDDVVARGGHGPHRLQGRDEVLTRRAAHPGRSHGR